VDLPLVSCADGRGPFWPSRSAIPTKVSGNEWRLLADFKPLAPRPRSKVCGSKHLPAGRVFLGRRGIVTDGLFLVFTTIRPFMI